MERKLATIRTIKALDEIPGADNIEVATVDGWKVVVKKGEFKVGQPCIYFEVDSLIPVRPSLEFLRKGSTRFLEGREYFRLKTIRLKGQISQGLALPLNFDEDGYGDLNQHYVPGDDVTDILEVTKWESNIPAHLSGKIKGNFPTFLRKTDEERIQNLSDSYENYKKHTYWVTEKLDGSSCTCYLNNGVFGVCSRNIDLLETPENTFWKVARAMEIEERMREFANGGNIALQGELIGNGVQGNKYSLEANIVRFYNVFFIDNQEYAPMSIFQEIIKRMGFQTVPILETQYALPPSIDELLKFAEGKSALNQHTEREGLVLRNEARTISFKVISNKFLLKNEE